MTSGMRAVLLGIAAGFAVLVAAWLWTRNPVRLPPEGPRAADVSRIISAHFATANALKVATLSGDVQTLAHDDRLGGLLHSRQATRFPYAVDYFVDLSRVSPADYHWDAASRTMTVRVGDVRVAAPNIDASRSESDRSGLFITRAAFDAMSREVAMRAIAVAADEANKPENLNAARNSAQVKVAALASAPLIAAGFGGVKVRVSFPWEPDAGRAVKWDESRAPGQVYNRAN